MGIGAADLITYRCLVLLRQRVRYEMTNIIPCLSGVSAPTLKALQAVTKE